MDNNKINITCLTIYEMIAIFFLGYDKGGNFSFDEVSPFVWLVVCVAIPLVLFLWRKEIKKYFLKFIRFIKKQYTERKKAKKIKQVKSENKVVLDKENVESEFKTFGLWILILFFIYFIVIGIAYIKDNTHTNSNDTYKPVKTEHKVKTQEQKPLRLDPKLMEVEIKPRRSYY